jgi:hypothetical protein
MASAPMGNTGAINSDSNVGGEQVRCMRERWYWIENHAVTPTGWLLAR